MHHNQITHHPPPRPGPPQASAWLARQWQEQWWSSHLGSGAPHPVLSAGQDTFISVPHVSAHYNWIQPKDQGHANSYPTQGKLLLDFRQSPVHSFAVWKVTFKGNPHLYKVPKSTEYTEPFLSRNENMSFPWQPKLLSHSIYENRKWDKIKENMRKCVNLKNENSDIRKQDNKARGEKKLSILNTSYFTFSLETMAATSSARRCMVMRRTSSTYSINLNSCSVDLGVSWILLWMVSKSWLSLWKGVEEVYEAVEGSRRGEWCVKQWGRRRKAWWKKID